MSRVAVVMGGTSSEREVSLSSGRAVAGALREAGCEVVEVVLEQDAIDAIPRDVKVVFLALHGGYGEGGGIQADLDRAGISYTGPGADASRLAMDKVATKERLRSVGVPTAEWEVLPAGIEQGSMSLPVVVKPPRDGSSVGVCKVSEEFEWPAAVAEARGCTKDGEVLVERFIQGREFAVSVLDGRALPVVEIRVADGWYDYESKYNSGGAQYLFPNTGEDQALMERCQELACRAYEALGCRGVSRVDFRVDESGELYVLEVNTIPGMTASSLLPKAAAEAGMSFVELCQVILRCAAHDQGV